ncbi:MULTISPECIES: YifB family Mg chelatase-like AAA ATPase [Arthrobacter]|uniref:YifB family Mg chelatase-like AAA ATPase n=2 Tax=Arthrobacter TaxID=1663 RepID=A0ABU9KI33_9MICC|nr:YifB family Mg chelatase-like AAA ATPase [Arthrobacter sp. YJM1]MDP5225584.1 YifB family Mg chelatase-like AAA ATPase [Arthrobacter sp. YJM1]
MGVGRCLSVALNGLQGRMVEVEADIGNTLPGFVILGLPDAALSESRERIRACASNSGIPLSRRKITVNLFPASLPKRGSGFDLAIAVAALAAEGDIRGTDGTVFLAELGLDGRLRPVRGVLPAVAAAVRAGHRKVVVAHGNAAEAALVPGAEVKSYTTLARLVLDFGADPKDLRLDFDPEEAGRAPAPGTESRPEPDLSEVAGQAGARFALEVAAAGAHHMLMVGPPGAGKTMLAERLPGLLPPLNDEAALEVTSILSLSHQGEERTELIRRPPFENPHHTASCAAIVGGGSGLPRPGAASRAHRGVLFLDEAPEYERRVLDALRQPLEHGELVIHRATGTAAYPARFQLILAANPCPCGKASGKGTECTCTPTMRRRYFGRLSGPLLDRVDIQLGVQKISRLDLASLDEAEDTATVRYRVAEARRAQHERLAPLTLETNSMVPGRLLRGRLRLDGKTTRILDGAMDRGALSARGYDRVLRLAWTLADLAGAARPDHDHVGQALMLRSPEVMG